MNKTCTKCGNELDLGKRFCSCGAFNPFYISGYAKPAENKIITNTDIRHEETAINLVREVREELHHLEAENNRLKEEVEKIKDLRNSANEQGPALQSVRPGKPKSNNIGNIMVIMTAALLISLTYLALFYLAGKRPVENKIAQIPAVEKVQKVTLTTPVPVVKDTTVVNGSSFTEKNQTQNNGKQITDTKHNTQDNGEQTQGTRPASSAGGHKTEDNNQLNDSDVPVHIKQPSGAAITAAKVRADLVGKKLSGCGIIINSAAEINQLENLVLVEKLSSDNLKYYFTLKVKSGGETYKAAPYIYYAANGSFIKVDGTNCE